MTVTRWNSDRFSYGSYSYSAVGNDQPKDRLALKQTVAGRIFFAGEATSVDYPATTTGAYLSGLDAAAAIIKASKN